MNKQIGWNASYRPVVKLKTSEAPRAKSRGIRAKASKFSG